MKQKRIAVLMGGNSSEREVSLKTGEQVMRFLDREKYEGVVVEIKDDRWRDELKKVRPEVVFVALHGAEGENGTIQGQLEEMGLNYTGSGVRASQIGMDKILFKKIVADLPITLPRVFREDNVEFPCVVKPSDQGSSVGVSIVESKTEMERAVAEARKFDKEILIEEYIKGTEVSAGLLQDNELIALPVIEIIPKLSSFFDYKSKYQSRGSEEIVPARIDKRVADLVQDQAKKIFTKLGCRGYARVDFIIKDQVPYLLEINTLPGLTEASLLPQEAAAVGISYRDLLTKIIEAAELI